MKDFVRELLAMAKEISARDVVMKGGSAEYFLTFQDRKVPGGEFVNSVDSVGYDGRSWWWVAPNGLKSADRDESRFRYRLSQELRSSLKAGRIMSMLRDELEKAVPMAASENDGRTGK